MRQGWMVRAGQSGRLFDEFQSNSVVAIGWSEIGELSKFSCQNDIYQAYIEKYENDKLWPTANAVEMIYKFIHGIAPGDLLISYSADRRFYGVYKDLGRYEFNPDILSDPDYANIRFVEKLGAIERDNLSASVKYSLGSILMLYSLRADVTDEIERALHGERFIGKGDSSNDELVQIEDRISRWSDEEIVHHFPYIYNLTLQGERFAGKDDSSNNELVQIKDKIIRLSRKEREHLQTYVLKFIFLILPRH